MHPHLDFSLRLLLGTEVKLPQTNHAEQKAKTLFVARRPCVCLRVQISLGVARELVTRPECCNSPGCEQFLCISLCCVAVFVDPNKCGNSQMPRHLISDAHEWINEIPTVPICYLAKRQQRERTL